MNFCPKCGSSIKEDAEFCHNCGYNIKSKSNDTAEDSKFEDSENQEEKIHKVNDKLKDIKSILNNKILISIISACVLIILFIFIGKTISSPEKAVASFENDINKSDATALTEILYTSDGRINLASDNVDPLLKSFKNTPSELSSTISNLNSQAVNLKNGGIENENSDLYITKVGRTLIFFPKYKIAFKPVFLTLTSNVKGADILINSKKMATTDSENFSKQFGPYVPGLYTISGNASGSALGTMYNQTKVDFLSDKKQSSTIDVLKGLYLEVNSDYDNNEIYINGKDTGKSVNSGTKIGPIASGSSVYGVINYNGEQIKSSSSNISDNDSTINFNYSKQGETPEQQQSDINNMITGYASALADALTSGYTNQIELYIYPGSKLNNQQMDTINSYYKGNNNFYEKYDSAVVNSYKMDTDGKSGTVDATEVYDINENYYEPNSQTKTRTFENIYKFKYNDTTQTYQLTERTSAVEK